MSFIRHHSGVLWTNFQILTMNIKMPVYWSDFIEETSRHLTHVLNMTSWICDSAEQPNFPVQLHTHIKKLRHYRQNYMSYSIQIWCYSRKMAKGKDFLRMVEVLLKIPLIQLRKQTYKPSDELWYCWQCRGTTWGDGPDYRRQYEPWRKMRS